MVLVSILIPVYNVERYLLESLESVKHQTFQDFEAVIVDDGSTDKTRDVAEKFAAADPRFIVIANSGNQGIAKSLNRAFHRSKGDYIARMDGDDIMAVDRLERQLHFLATRSDVDLVGTSLIIIDEEGRELRRTRKPSGEANIRRLLRYGPPVAHPTWLARRVVYSTLREYRMSSVEDYDFLLRADLLRFRIENMSDYFGLRFRVRSGNTATTQSYVQARLHNYALKLYKRAKAGHPIAFDREFVQNIRRDKRSPLARLHSLSSSLVAEATTRRNPGARFTLMLLSSLISPYRFQYVLRRLRYKLANIRNSSL